MPSDDDRRAAISRMIDALELSDDVPDYLRQEQIRNLQKELERTDMDTMSQWDHMKAEQARRAQIEKEAEDKKMEETEKVNQENIGRDGASNYFDGLRDATRATVPALGAMDAEERELFLKTLGENASESVRIAAFRVQEARRLASEDDPDGCERLAQKCVEGLRTGDTTERTRLHQESIRLRERAVTLRELQAAEGGLSRLTGQGRVTPEVKARFSKEISRLRGKLAKDD